MKIKTLMSVYAFANTPPLQGQIYFSASQLAARLGISRTTLWRYCKNDPSFPQPIKFGKVTRRWKLSEVVAWEESRLK